MDLRNRIEFAGFRSIYLIRVSRRRDTAPVLHGATAAPAGGLTGERPPAADRGRRGTALALLAHSGNRDTNRVVSEGVRVEAGDFRSEIVVTKVRTGLIGSRRSQGT